ncbi:hypothetical protein BH09BAC6_BH09BAC6_28560 [soil metagenome]
MRKIALGVAIICFTALLSGLAITIISKKNESARAMLSRKILPNYKFYSASTLTEVKAIVGAQNKLIIYFDPECEHCQQEMGMIIKNINLLKNTSIVMVSSNTPKKIDEFSSSFNLNKYPQIQMLWDKNYAFYTWFGHADAPSIYIYNPNNQLVKIYHGETKMEAILKFLI